MDDHPEVEMPQEEKNGEDGDGASEVPSSVSELRADNPSLGGLNQVMERLECVVGRVGNLVQEVKDLREAQGMDKLAPVEAPVAAPAVEGPCPICGGTGVFGVSELWLYLVFAILGFLMGYIAMVHGRG